MPTRLVLLDNDVIVSLDGQNYGDKRFQVLSLKMCFQVIQRFPSLNEGVLGRIIDILKRAISYS